MRGLLGGSRCEARRVVGFGKLGRCVGVVRGVERGIVVLREGLMVRWCLAGGGGLLSKISLFASVDKAVVWKLVRKLMMQ